MNRRFFIILVVMVLLMIVAPVSAGGAMQISGVGFFAGAECSDAAGAGADFANNLTGDFEGCLYIFVESYECRPSGTYIETGTEIYVGSGDEGDDGTFSTTYRFTGKFDDCPNLAEQVFGRCQHPIIAGSGDGDFYGVTGRLDFKDDVDAGNFPYTGHLRW